MGVFKKCLVMTEVHISPNGKGMLNALGLTDSDGIRVDNGGRETQKKFEDVYMLVDGDAPFYAVRKFDTDMLSLVFYEVGLVPVKHDPDDIEGLIESMGHTIV